MPANDRAHFESYREQTRAKHTILEKYIPAFFHILKAYNKNLVYFDGFAGRGSYTDTTTGEEIDGSPLRALAAISKNDALAGKVTTIFVEKDPELAEPLERRVESFHVENPHIRKPRVYQAEFEQVVLGHLDHMKQGGKQLAPCFMFVDPCGVAGASFEAIKRLMDEAQAEVFVFFNLDGIRRILGLGDRMGPTLPELLGSQARTDELRARYDACTTSTERDECIVKFYDELVRSEVGADYVTTFRVEKEGQKATSHYLIHVTRHSRGFAIMKDVMWGVGQTAEGYGGLALEQKSLQGGPMLIAPEWDAVLESVVAELEAGTKRVSHFYETLSQQPANKLCEAAYRRALIELEEDGKVQVLDKQGVNPMPAGMRRKRKGQTTLAKDYYVRLAT